MKKILVKLFTLTLLTSTISPLVISAEEVNTKNISYTDNQTKSSIQKIEKDFGKIDQRMLDTGRKLEKYFTLTNNKVTINSSANTIAKDLKISLSDAQSIIDATNETNELNMIQPRGFVGVYINLGPKVRKMNGWVAGAFVGGYVGWYAKQFAAAGPVGAGVAAVITGAAAASAKWAVENKVRRISLGKYIGGWNWTYSINVP